MTSVGIFLSCRRESHTSASKGWRFPTIVHFSFSRDSPESVSSLRLRQPLWRSACSGAVNNAVKIQICGLSLCQIFCRMLISFFESLSGFLTKISHLLSCQSFVVSICCYIIIHYSGGKQQSKMSEERLRKTKQFTRRIKKTSPATSVSRSEELNILKVITVCHPECHPEFNLECQDQDQCTCVLKHKPRT